MTGWSTSGRAGAPGAGAASGGTTPVPGPRYPPTRTRRRRPGEGADTPRQAAPAARVRAPGAGAAASRSTDQERRRTVSEGLPGRSTERRYARVPLWLFQSGVSLQAIATDAWLHGRYGHLEEKFPSYRALARE